MENIQEGSAISKELLSKAKICVCNNENSKAQVLLNEIIEGGERNKDILARAYFHLANIFHVRGEIGKAIKAFNKVLLLDPSHTDASISLSVLYNDIGQYDNAKIIFEKANERVKNRSEKGVEDKHINKKFSTKHLELAELYMSYNRYDEALFEYNKVIALNDENLQARINIAKVYAKKNFTAKAFAELRKLKSEHPSYLTARIALGVLYYGNGNILEAQSEWQKVLSKEPENSEAAMYLNLSKTATETRLC